MLGERSITHTSSYCLIPFIWSSRAEKINLCEKKKSEHELPMKVEVGGQVQLESCLKKSSG